MEEKKDGTEEEESRRIYEKGGVNDSEDEDGDENEELFDLPPEITELLGGDHAYKSEEDLQKALDNFGVGDLRIVLVDGKPRLVMPSYQHNAFTSFYSTDFERRFGQNKWGFSSSTHRFRLQGDRSRDPDLSYWGYPRCMKDENGALQPINLGKGTIPDVVIQFSWRNKKRYEENAINDMMNRGLEVDGGSLSSERPRLGYLIKVRFSKKRRLDDTGLKTQDLEGLDIYRLRHGTTIFDAHNSSNPNAEHWRYVPAGPEVLITIKPQDLGITGFWAVLCGEYKIKASVLFGKMKKYHAEFQSSGLAT